MKKLFIFIFLSFMTGCTGYPSVYQKSVSQQMLEEDEEYYRALDLAVRDEKMSPEKAESLKQQWRTKSTAMYDRARQLEGEINNLESNRTANLLGALSSQTAPQNSGIVAVGGNSMYGHKVGSTTYWNDGSYSTEDVYGNVRKYGG